MHFLYVVVVSTDESVHATRPSRVLPQLSVNKLKQMKDTFDLQKILPGRTKHLKSNLVKQQNFLSMQ